MFALKFSENVVKNQFVKNAISLRIGETIIY